MIHTCDKFSVVLFHCLNHTFLLSVVMFPKYGVVYWGDTVVLKCSQTPTAEWLVNDTILPSKRDQILILPAVSSKDSGDYQCQATEKSEKFRIDVLGRFNLMSTFMFSGSFRMQQNNLLLFKLFYIV